MSQIQGRVLDSSVYAWLADVTVSLSAAGYATVVYVDGSLAERDASIVALFDENVTQDASIVAINLLKADITYVDASLVNRDTSINTLYDENDTQDASIDAINTILITNTAILAQHDASIIELRAEDLRLDASLNIVIDQIGINILGIEDASTRIAANDVSINRLDGSVNYLFDNPSAGDVTKAYVDASLGQRDVSISWNTSAIGVNVINIADASVRINTNYTSIGDVSTRINTNFTNIGDASTRININYTSIGDVSTRVTSNDTSIAWLNTNKLNIDTSLSDLSDISVGGIGSPQDGSALVYNSDGDYWEYGTAGSGSGGSTTLNALTDTSVGTRTDGDLIQWTNDTSTWDNITPVDVSSLTVDISSLTVDASNYFIQGVGYLGDVSVAGIGLPQDGSALVWDGDTSTWTYGVAGGSGGGGDVTQAYVDASLGARDVSIAWNTNAISLNTTNIGDASTRIGANDTSIAWLNTNKLHSDASLSDLSDVSTGGVVDGDLLISASEYYIPITPTDISTLTVDISTLTVDGSEYFQPYLALNTGAKLGGADGSIGDWSIDDTYLYLCTADSSWGRISLTRF